jgi:hypothetical protein
MKIWGPKKETNKVYEVPTHGYMSKYLDAVGFKIIGITFISIEERIEKYPLTSNDGVY